MAKSEPFAAFGKQVKRGRQHIADACDETVAAAIVAALNGPEKVADAVKALHRQNAGHARAAALTPEHRREIARKAANTRWGKRKA